MANLNGLSLTTPCIALLLALSLHKAALPLLVCVVLLSASVLAKDRWRKATDWSAMSEDDWKKAEKDSKGERSSNSFVLN